MTDPLATAQIGATSVQVTRYGLGTVPLAGWPTAVPRGQAVATIEKAWEVGVRYFDTAPFYGTGLAEQLVGEVLGPRDREAFTLSTKVGRLLVPGEMDPPFFHGGLPFQPVFDYSASGVRQSLQESYERLNLAGADIVYIHDPDDHHEEALGEAYPALAEARAEGWIGAIGVGMNWAEPLSQFIEEASFDCVLCAGRYTLLEQESLDTLMSVAVERGVSVIAGGVYNSGLLVRPSPEATYNYARANPALVDRAQKLEAVCREFGVPLRAAAAQFPLAHPAVASVVIGARSPAEVEDNLQMLRVDVPGELWATLKERELLRSDAPTPA